MKLPDVLIESIVRTEEALDRLKLAYKERFNRFDAARPVPYRGYGRPTALVLRGRVLEDTETGFDPEPGWVANVRNTVRRLETDEIRGARLRVRFRDIELEVVADDEAFFEARIEPDEPVEPGWHEVTVEIVESMASETVGPVKGEVLVPPAAADFLVVSDLDDTVLHTGATDRLGMMRTVVTNDAHSRTPLEGVASLYRDFVAGPRGDGANPIVYLSRSPWNLYGMVTGFLEHHGLPRGPVLLKDYDLRGMLASENEAYKHERLTELLDFYPSTDFVLIGDSGQHDPEAYLRIVRERPERVRAIFIRDISPPERDREVDRIAAEVGELGVAFVRAATSAEIRRAAARLGLVARE